MSNDPCMDSLGYPFGDVRYIARRTPSDPRTGCSFIVCRILTFLELRLGDLVSALGWEICWMEYIWDEKPPCVIPRTTAPATRLLFHFECLLFYCPHLLLFFALSITLGNTAIFDSNKVSHPSAKWHNARCGCGSQFTRKRARRPASRLGFVWKGLYFVNGSGLARCRYEQYQASCSYNDKG
jgi:hypothetical protein